MGQTFEALLAETALQQSEVSDRFSELIRDLPEDVETLSAIGVDTEFYPDRASITRWKNGTRLPKRPNHLYLIWGFHKLDVLSTVVEANRWLALAGHEALSIDEAMAIFGDTKIAVAEPEQPRMSSSAQSLSTLPAAWTETLPEFFTFTRSLLFPLGNLRQAHTALCQQIRSVWIDDVLRHSFYDATVILDVNLQEMPDLVRPTWNDVLPQPSPLPAAYLLSSQIRTLFSAAHHRLLIVGGAGCGKTTLLLQLVDQLTQVAINDPSQPLPMLLNLISWNIRKQPLADWLVEEICRRYFITKRVARYWVEHDKLLLLLDGFDEVEVDAREHCIKTINEFLTHHPLPVAICSRDTDYMAQVGRLNLERAILVQRLSHAQIDEYLTNLQLPESFRTLVTQEDPYLAELAATPMLLHLLINTVDGQKTLTHSSSVVGQNTYFQLFEAYIHHMLAGRNNQPEPIADTAVYTHLGWIAEQMQCQSLNLFVVEQLQPICLPHLSERIQYVLVSRLLVGTVGGIVGGLFIGAAYAVFNGAGMEGLMRGLVEGLISGVCGGLIIGAIDRWRLTHRNWRSVADTVHGFVGMLIETGIITLSVGLTVWIGIVLFLGLPRWLAYSLTFWANEGGIVGLLAGLTFGLFFGYKQWTTGHYRFQDDIATVEQISWSNPMHCVAQGMA
ncbi:MAG: NACHT domain-containing protein [Caldilineaceae bacterium]